MSAALLNMSQHSIKGIVSALVRAMITGKVPLTGVHHHDPPLGGLVVGNIVDITQTADPVLGDDSFLGVGDPTLDGSLRGSVDHFIFLSELCHFQFYVLACSFTEG